MLAQLTDSTVLVSYRAEKKPCAYFGTEKRKIEDIRLDKIRKQRKTELLEIQGCCQRLQHLYLSLRQKLGGRVVITDMEHAVPALKKAKQEQQYMPENKAKKVLTNNKIDDNI